MPASRTMLATLAHCSDCPNAEPASVCSVSIPGCIKHGRAAQGAGAHRPITHYQNNRCARGSTETKRTSRKSAQSRKGIHMAQTKYIWRTRQRRHAEAASRQQQATGGAQGDHNPHNCGSIRWRIISYQGLGVKIRHSPHWMHGRQRCRRQRPNKSTHQYSVLHTNTKTNKGSAR